MACPQSHPAAPAANRPPARGWYWNANHLARAWLPLIGPEGLGLLDFYLAMADHRPGAPMPGWTAITLDELTHLTGWGRARLVRLNRLLTTAGLLSVRYRPVAGHGPAVQRAFYRVERQAGPPTAAVLTALTALAGQDPTLAARLRRYTLRDAATSLAAELETPPTTASHEAAEQTVVLDSDPVPVSAENRSVDLTQTPDQITTTSAPARTTIMPPPISDVPPAMTAPSDQPVTTAPAPTDVVLNLWRAANGRPASALERQRLAQLAAQAARGSGDDLAVGWERVGAAITEAVEAGSAFVAPRRVARILERWQAVDTAPAGQDDRSTKEPAAAVDPPPTLPAPEEATAWQPPRAIPGLPAAPAAVLSAALAAAGLQAEPYLRGAALAGWSDGPASSPVALCVATPASAPPVVVARLQPRLSQGLSAVLGRPVTGLVRPMAALVASTHGAGA